MSNATSVIKFSWKSGHSFQTYKPNCGKMPYLARRYVEECFKKFLDPDPEIRETRTIITHDTVDDAGDVDDDDQSRSEGRGKHRTGTEIKLRRATIRDYHDNIFSVISVSGCCPGRTPSGLSNFDVTVGKKASHDDRITVRPRLTTPAHCLSSVHLSAQTIDWGQRACSIISVIIIKMRSNHRASAADVWWPWRCDLFSRTTLTADEPDDNK